METTTREKALRFRGAAQFRHRIVLATLSGKEIRIDDIRVFDENPGIRDFEASFLRLMDKLTNGTAIFVNDTGTTVRYKPGVLIGGSGLSHDCPPSRAVGYYAEALLMLAPFCKKDVAISLKGVTNGPLDISVDLIRTVTLPVLKHFGIEDGAELKIVRRGAPPTGGGEVVLRCSIAKQLKPIHLVDEGKVKRVRGIAYATRVSPQVTNRMVDTARGVLNHYLPDVYIFTDTYKGKDSGSSPGYAMSLVAETTTGVLLSTQRVTPHAPPELPEELGKSCASQLCAEIARGGCIDSVHQPLALLMMALCPEDVSTVRFGKLTQQSIEFLRLLKQTFGVVFKIAPDGASADTATVLLSCLGVGFQNIARRAV